MAASLYQTRATDQLNKLKEATRSAEKEADSAKLDSIVGLEE